MNVRIKVVDGKCCQTICATDPSENSAILELGNELQTLGFPSDLDCGNPTDSGRKYWVCVHLPVASEGLREWEAHVSNLQAYRDRLASAGWMGGSEYEGEP